MRKYLRDGSEVEVVQTIQIEGEEYHIVGRVLMDEDGEEADIGEPVIVDKVFDSPLRNKYSEESESEKKRLDRYKAEANELGAKIVALRKEHYELESQKKALISKLSQVEALKDIESILEGKFTHYVLLQEYSGIPSIITADEAKKSDYYRTPTKHVLSLFGDVEGGFEWNKTSDFRGYGDFKRCIPCKSLEAAKAKEKEIILGLLAEKLSHRLGDYIAAADKAGVEVPAEYREALRNEEKKRLFNRLAEARKSVGSVLKDFKAAGLLVPGKEEQVEEEEKPF